MAEAENEPYINVAAETEDILYFNDPQFYIEERDFPTLSNILTPIEFIKQKLKKIKNNLTFLSINAQSIAKHHEEISRLLIETGVDILAVSETCL